MKPNPWQRKLCSARILRNRERKRGEMPLLH
jgi:hypothetical protein